MNEYLFTIHNALVMCADGSFDIDDTEYSCMYDIVGDGDEACPVIDLRSFKYKHWHDRKWQWMRCDAPIPPVVGRLQEQIQRAMDVEQLVAGWS